MSPIEKYRLAFEVSPVPKLLVNDAGDIVLANLAFCALFEYEPDDLIGMGVESLVPETIRAHHPELREAYAKAPVKRSMGTGRDLYGITRNGERIPLELGLEPVSHGDGIWALVVAIDIRQRKRLEERMRVALDAAASAMVMVNEAGRIALVNKAALELFGYAQDDLMNQPVEVLVPDSSKRAHPVYLNSFMNERSTRSMGLGRDLFARHRDGHHIPVEITLTPVDTHDETLVMSTIIDLTERVAASASLEKKNEELASLNTDLSQFAYSASHDLKAPLLSVSGILRLCIEDLERGDVDELLESLKDAEEISTRSAQKIEEVLQIARASRDSIPAEPVHVRSILENVWLDVAGRSELVRLELDLQHSDPVMLEQATFGVIIDNLLSNAYRYRDDTKPDSIVRVCTQDSGDNLCVTVYDNGIGIPIKNQPRVFDMFKRLDERSGNGLGLALVKKQVDRLGGEVTLASVEGEGTEFSLTLPRGGTTDGENSSGDR